MLQAYVGAALTGAPPEFVNKFLPELKARIRLMDIHVLDFIGLEGETAVKVYVHDRDCTELADVCVFLVGEPSTGLGMEIMIREATGKPALFFAQENARVTRMLLGFLEVRGQRLHRYNTVEDICRVLHEHLLAQDPDYESRG